MSQSTLLERESNSRRCKRNCAAADSTSSRVLQALHATGRLPLREVSAIVSNGHVLLKGCVPSYYLKQIAQTACMTVDGVESLDNCIAVR